MVRYSQRLPWSFTSNSLSNLSEAKRLAGDAVLDLAISNPVAAALDYPHREIAAAFGTLDNLSYHPGAFGEMEARDAVCGYYEHRGLAVPAQRIALTASTSEAYSLLFKVLCDPGAEVLVPAPSYPLFEYLAALESVRAVPYRLLYDGEWFFDLDHLRSTISPRTRAIVIVSPNNPTGSFLKNDERAALFSLSLEFNLPIICDEVFTDYSFFAAGNRVMSLAGTDAVLSFSLNGLSKVAGMPQLKLGWIAINGPEADCRQASKRLEIVLDTYLSVGTPVQRALPKLLQLGEGIQQQLRRRTAANLAAAHSILGNSAAHCLRAEGGWSAILRLPATYSEEFWVTTLLLHYGVLVQPGYFFDMGTEAYIVVSLITRPDEFAAGLGFLKQMLETYTAETTPA